MPKVAAEVGSTANKYEILAKLATGGMADIFLARGESAAGVERYCVLKRILRERASDMQLVQMFLDEARLAAQLQHPNIASVYDTGRLGESYFFTMEYVHGETVRSLIQRSNALRRPVPLACALTIVAGAAAGLHHAHERKGVDGRALGIVHRDVSPSNLMVSYEGNIKVVDFGVAKASHRVIETRSGTVKGKISYLSPEQCRGERVDRRSDLFSLGIVMWEMLTGARLYRRNSDFANMNAIVNEQAVAPSVHRADLPREIDEIVVRLLARHTGERFQSADEVVDRIEAVAVGAGFMLSASAVGRFVRELFGERLEPWLDLATQTAPHGPMPLTASSATSLLPADQIEQQLAEVAEIGASSGSEQEDGSDSDAQRSLSAPTVSVVVAREPRVEPVADVRIADAPAPEPPARAALRPMDVPTLTYLPPLATPGAATAATATVPPDPDPALPAMVPLRQPALREAMPPPADERSPSSAESPPSIAPPAAVASSGSRPVIAVLSHVDPDASPAAPRWQMSARRVSLAGAIALAGVLTLWLATHKDSGASGVDGPAVALVVPAAPEAHVDVAALPDAALHVVPPESPGAALPAEAPSVESPRATPPGATRFVERRDPTPPQAPRRGRSSASTPLPTARHAEPADVRRSATPPPDPPPRMRPTPDVLSELERCRASAMTAPRAQDCTRVACRAGAADKALRWVRYIPLAQRAEVTAQCRRLGIDLARQDRTCDDPRDCP